MKGKDHLVRAGTALGLLIAAAPAMMTTPTVTLAGTQNNNACASPYGVTITPSDFQAGKTPNPIDNPYMPLTPYAGKTFIYDGTKDGQPEHDEITVTTLHPLIMGVYTTEIHDNVYVNGQLVESTQDWYAQDKAGSVWYFGEFTSEYDPTTGAVSHEGSWTAGNGNLPGIVMEAHPQSGDTYRQEYAPPTAEDMASVTSQSWHLTVPYGSYNNVLVTKESSCVETGSEHKYYGQGVGLLQVVAVSSGRNGSEQLQLTTIR